MRNSPADTKVRERGGGGREGAPGTRAHIPLQHMEETMARQVVPLQPMESPCWRRLLGGSCNPWKGAHSEGFLSEIVAHEGPTLERSVPEGLHPWEGPHIRAGKKLEADTECYRLTTATVAHPQCTAWGGEGGR